MHCLFCAVYYGQVSESTHMFRIAVLGAVRDFDALKVDRATHPVRTAHYAVVVLHLFLLKFEIFNFVSERENEFRTINPISALPAGTQSPHWNLYLKVDE